MDWLQHSHRPQGSSPSATPTSRQTTDPYCETRWERALTETTTKEGRDLNGRKEGDSLKKSERQLSTTSNPALNPGSSRTELKLQSFRKPHELGRTPRNTIPITQHPHAASNRVAISFSPSPSLPKSSPLNSLHNNARPVETPSAWSQEGCRRSCAS